MAEGPESGALRRINELVRHCYWVEDFNCAQTTLIALSNLLAFPLHSQVHAAAAGMHGAGLYRAQCGLVEGALMFIGAYFTGKGAAASDIALICRTFAAAFEKEFGSLQCSVLRPGGFSPDDAEHMCAPLSLHAIGFSYNFIMNERNGPISLPDGLQG